MGFAGIPPATVPDGISEVTTAPAAIKQLLPIFDPAVMTTCAATQDPFPMDMGANDGKPYLKEPFIDV